MSKDTIKGYQIKIPTLDERMQEEGFKRVTKLEVQADGSITLPVDLVPNTKGGRNIFGQPYVELRIIDEIEINPYLKRERTSFIVYKRDTRR